MQGRLEGIETILAFQDCKQFWAEAKIGQQVSVTGGCFA
jgi:hypothetical protein